MQRLRRLVTPPSARQAERAFVAEGAKVLSEALAAGAPVESVYVAPGGEGDAVVRAAFERGVRVYPLEDGVMERIADTVTPQPLLGVVGYVDVELEELRLHADNAPVVVCIDLRDPGNAGTVLRSAEAAGAAGVLFCGGSVDVYNPKTVRASAGSLFHVPVVTGGSPREVLETLAGWGVHRLATAARGGDPYDRVDLTRPVAFVLGNEAHGLGPDVIALVDGSVTIPMTGRSESLNVGVAAAVLCFEAARQRRAGEPA